jgi:hypothetical protein
MALHSVEKRLERLVEGAFARVFKTQLRPVELGRRVAREMDVHVNLGVRGERVAPNHMRILLSPEDYERFLPFSEALVIDLADAVEAHAKEQNYQLKGPGVVELIVEEKRRPGNFDVKTAIAAAPNRGRPNAWLILPDGSSVAVIDGDPVVLGRMPDCDVVLNDTNVSRRHTEVRMIDGKASVVDLGSLNGTKVNGRGVPINQFGTPIDDGDIISVGPVKVTFSTKRPGS